MDQITTPSGSGTVLVIDDDRTVQLLHAAILSRAGYRSVAVASGAAGLSALGGEAFDLVLLDSRMPGMSGIEFLIELRGRGSVVPVILVTGAGETEDLVRGLDSGADDYITKPVVPAELMARVRAHLRGRRAAIATSDGSAADDAADRRAILEIIDRGEFNPVFQPIVDFRDRATVAFEALTRFTDGRAPDQLFAAAARVGVGSELALATLSASIRAARHLPGGTALHLNVSPDLLREPALAGLLASSDRPVVVEITEHDHIDDYADVSRHLARLGDVRLAIDDAGAGYASMTHILALDPDEVKLDREWVTGVDVDRARRALIAGLVTFAQATGTTLVAEGIETESELETLVGLGVSHGQGYYLGRPAPSSAWRNCEVATQAKVVPAMTSFRLG